MKMLGSPAPTSPGKTRSAAGTERQRLYQTARWRKLRKAHLATEPLCVHCQREGRVVQAAVVDHILGHDRPDWRERFFDPANLMSLCKPHHDRKTGRETHGGGGGQSSGNSIASNHPSPFVITHQPGIPDQEAEIEPTKTD